MARATAVPATLFTGSPDEFVSFAASTPGAFCYAVYGAVPNGRMLYSCPCGCGAIGMLYVRPFPEKPFWSNLGTLEVPTLQPSIGLNGGADAQDIENDGFHWHGYLMEGVWHSVFEGRA